MSRKRRRTRRPRRETPKPGRWYVAVIDGAAVRVKLIELVSGRRVVVWRLDRRQKIELEVTDLW